MHIVKWKQLDQQKIVINCITIDFNEDVLNYLLGSLTEQDVIEYHNHLKQYKKGDFKYTNINQLTY